MKIALLTTMKYGLTQFIFRDTLALSQKGHEMRLFTLRSSKGLYNPLPEWRVITASAVKGFLSIIKLILMRPVLFVKLLGTALRTGSMIDLIIGIHFAANMDGIDVIYAYFGDHKLYAGYYCKRITGIPLIVSIRAYELHWNPNFKMFAEALPYCDRVVTITEYNKKMLIEKYAVPEKEIDIVRQIVNLDVYKHEDKIKILIVGFFAEKKGHEILFKAIKQLNRDDIEIWVVGDSAPDRCVIDCRQMAKELGLESQVAFFGQQSNNALRALYRECDIFCLPSRTDRHGNKEGFPNVIAEAMAFGKPVISTRHAGIPEMIEDAFVADENNVEQLVGILKTVIDSSVLREKMGARNRAMVEKEFSMGNNDKLEHILKSYSKASAGNHKDGNSSDVMNTVSSLDVERVSSQNGKLKPADEQLQI